MKNTPPSAQTEWKKEIMKYIGGYCWYADGGNGGYSESDVIAYVEKLLASERTRLLSVENHESTAWCECGDALETKPIMKKLDKPTDFGTGRGLVSEIIDHYEYYCFGCDETYKLVRQSILSEMEKGGDK